MVGFVHNTNKTHTLAAQEITCFYAEQDKKALYDDEVGDAAQKMALKHNKIDKEMRKITSDTKKSALAQTTESSRSSTLKGKKPNLFHQHKPSKEMDIYI